MWKGTTDQAVTTDARTMISRTLQQVRQFLCGLHGHDSLLHFQGRHVSLVCMSCAYESPGWCVPGAAKAAETAHARRERLDPQHRRKPLVAPERLLPQPHP